MHCLSMRCSVFLVLSSWLGCTRGVENITQEWANDNKECFQKGLAHSFGVNYSDVTLRLRLEYANSSRRLTQWNDAFTRSMVQRFSLSYDVRLQPGVNRTEVQQHMKDLRSNTSATFTKYVEGTMNCLNSNGVSVPTKLEEQVKLSLGYWLAGPWSQCSNECGIGVKRRNVACIEDNQKGGNETLCNMTGPMPEAEGVCEEKAGCPYDPLCPLEEGGDGMSCGLQSLMILSCMIVPTLLTILCTVFYCIYKCQTPKHGTIRLKSEGPFSKADYKIKRPKGAATKLGRRAEKFRKLVRWFKLRLCCCIYKQKEEEENEDNVDGELEEDIDPAKDKLGRTHIVWDLDREQVDKWFEEERKASTAVLLANPNPASDDFLGEAVARAFGHNPSGKEGENPSWSMKNNPSQNAIYIHAGSTVPPAVIDLGGLEEPFLVTAKVITKSSDGCIMGKMAVGPDGKGHGKMLSLEGGKLVFEISGLGKVVGTKAIDDGEEHEVGVRCWNHDTHYHLIVDGAEDEHGLHKVLDAPDSRWVEGQDVGIGGKPGWPDKSPLDGQIFEVKWNSIPVTAPEILKKVPAVPMYQPGEEVEYYSRTNCTWLAGKVQVTTFDGDNKDNAPSVMYSVKLISTGQERFEVVLDQMRKPLREGEPAEIFSAEEDCWQKATVDGPQGLAAAVRGYRLKLDESGAVMRGVGLSFVRRLFRAGDPVEVYRGCERGWELGEVASTDRDEPAEIVGKAESAVARKAVASPGVNCVAASQLSVALSRGPRRANGTALDFTYVVRVRFGALEEAVDSHLVRFTEDYVQELGARQREQDGEKKGNAHPLAIQNGHGNAR